MKVLHSFWSKPGRASEGNRIAGGWANPVYYYMSWALSCLQFRTYYDHVELVTDTFGKKILVDLIGLPYTQVSTALDELEDFPTDLWTMGKFRAYALQKEPFIHADGDVFLFRPLANDLLESPLVAQHMEVDYPYYKSILQQVRQNFTFIPAYITKNIASYGLSANAYNAGIIGGQDLDFMQHYVQEATTFLESNRQHWSSVQIRELNILYEQYLFYCLTQHENRPVRCLLDQVSYRHEGLTDFAGIPERSHYVHPVASFKSNLKNCEQLAYRLRQNHPAYYYRILHLATEKAI
ncbi:MAG: DUF6734 family protein [Cyclobacteriaceae bacterium]